MNLLIRMKPSNVTRMWRTWAAIAAAVCSTNAADL
jgi:hypothetical protein